MSSIHFQLALMGVIDPCRCIVVTTTLSEETLSTAGPSLIRKDIGNIRK